MAQPILREVSTAHTPESLGRSFANSAGFVLLESQLFTAPGTRYSFVCAEPFLTFRSHGSHCEFSTAQRQWRQFGNPWNLLDVCLARFEMVDEIDLPFPLGGAFGFWGYDLKNFVEPKLPRRALNDLEMPGAWVGFYDSLVVFDHALGKTWIVSTGLQPDGSRDPIRAADRFQFWIDRLAQADCPSQEENREESPMDKSVAIDSTWTKVQFIQAVQHAQHYIQHGHIYQVNLSHRLVADLPRSPWQFHRALADRSPAPCASFINAGDFQIASASPESFLSLHGRSIQTRPIKGTRPRSNDATRDAQLTYELQTSAKEMAELVMITDLLRNDLGRICTFGSVHVPELVRLERYPQVQHLVSTVAGQLNPGLTHFQALASCFPGGSVTGAPKFRAMEIIDELEPVSRGPYTGAIGYLGFNQQSQFSIAIRTGTCLAGRIYFPVGAGIVADSIPEAEYEETWAKGAGFVSALQSLKQPDRVGK